MMFMFVKWPFVEVPFVPEQWDDPPEIPDQRFAVDEFVVPVRIAQAPVAKIAIIEKCIIDHAKNHNSDGSEHEPAPGVHIVHGNHIVEIMMPCQERNQCETGDFSGMIPQESQFFRFFVHVVENVTQPDGRNFHADCRKDKSADNDQAEGNQPLGRLWHGDGGPGFAPPDVGGHEEDNDHPFPPAEHPVNM